MLTAQTTSCFSPCDNTSWFKRLESQKLTFPLTVSDSEVMGGSRTHGHAVRRHFDH